MKAQKTIANIKNFTLAKRFVKVHPTLYIGAAFKGNAQCLGLFGEALAAKRLEFNGCDVVWCATLDCGYDLLVDNIKTEVKTARLNKRGQFQFCLSKRNHANIKKADCVILQCVLQLGYVISFTVPVEMLGDRNQITLPGNLEGYNGFFAQYKI